MPALSVPSTQVLRASLPPWRSDVPAASSSTPQLDRRKRLLALPGLLESPWCSGLSLSHLQLHLGPARSRCKPAPGTHPLLEQKRCSAHFFSVHSEGQARNPRNQRHHITTRPPHTPHAPHAPRPHPPATPHSQHEHQVPRYLTYLAPVPALAARSQHQQNTAPGLPALRGVSCEV